MEVVSITRKKSADHPLAWLRSSERWVSLRALLNSIMATPRSCRASQCDHRIEGDHTQARETTPLMPKGPGEYGSMGRQGAQAEVYTPGTGWAAVSPMKRLSQIDAGKIRVRISVPPVGISDARLGADADRIDVITVVGRVGLDCPQGRSIGDPNIWV